MRRLFLLLLILAVFSPLMRAQTCDLSATTANFANQLAAANPGQTLCLATGNYGSFAGVTKTSPGVTITAASGATPTMTLSFAQTSPVAAWLILDNLTISSAVISGPAHDITIKNSHFSDKVAIYASANNNACSGCPALSNSNILFNNDLFDMSANPSGAGGYEGRIEFVLSGPNPAGVTVENSRLTSGCADGVQFASGGYGVTIGPGNEFYNLQQGSCGPHIDSIQFVGTTTPGPVINGNYFHDNTTGIVAYDYVSSANITNNVLINITTNVLGGPSDPNSIVAHNTLYGMVLSCGTTHQGNSCSARFYDNISSGFLIVPPAAPSYEDYNLCTSGPCAGGGAHNLTGTPTYIGGNPPSTYAGYQLTATSLGHAAASDGTDVGANVSGGSTSNKPTAPTNLTVLVQ